MTALEKKTAAILDFMETFRETRRKTDANIAKLADMAQLMARGIDPTQIASIVAPYTPESARRADVVMRNGRMVDSPREVHITKVTMKDWTVYDLSDNPILQTHPGSTRG